MKFLSNIKSEQLNKFYAPTTKPIHLLLSLIAVISISLTCNSFAQSLSGGAGGNSGASVGGNGGASSEATGANGIAGGYVNNTSSAGGGGGGGGAVFSPAVGGGTGGDSVFYYLGTPHTNFGGAGGSTAGASGSQGSTGAFSGATGGGGGGGGAAGLYSNAGTLINNTSIAGGDGGAGGVSDSGGGGGGGAGGFGLSVYSTDVTNTGFISGGNGGVGGASNTADGGNGGDGGVGVYLTNNSSLINSGTITGGSRGDAGSGISYGIDGKAGPGVYVDSITVATIANNADGTITASTAGSGIVISNAASLTSLTNAGVISGRGAAAIENFGAITNLNNSGTIRGLYTADGLHNSGSIQNLNNSGILTGQSVGLINDVGATLNALINEDGGIIGGGGNGIINDGTIGIITNIGQIQAAFGGPMILNASTITTLNNLNGGITLRYDGILPNNYNVIITSTSNYGKLDVTFGAGITTFGIYTGSTVRSGTYASVLSGITSSNLTTTSGTFGSYSWILTNSSGTIWDLILSPLGPSVANTNQSLINTAQALQGTFTLQNSVLANSLGYDCNKFGGNGVCISTGGRYTAVSAADGLNNTSALLIAAYRLNQNYRIGAYVDQNLSVNNAGATVRLGNNTPLIGLFGAWNEKLDGTGTEVKVSAAYGKKNTTVNRQVVATSEPGTGSSQLNSQGAQVAAKHGFAVTDKAIVSPYIGMRYTQNNMQGYTEGTTDTVTAPLTYSALNTRATTVLTGVGVTYKINPTVTTFASAGLEADTKTGNGSYSGTNSNISGLTTVNFNANPVKVRASAVLGAYYDLEKNQRFAITGAYRQESYKAVSTTTVMATYTVGL
jgi:hypothetical protein